MVSEKNGITLKSLDLINASKQNNLSRKSYEADYLEDSELFKGIMTEDLKENLFKDNAILSLESKLISITAKVNKFEFYDRRNIFLEFTPLVIFYYLGFSVIGAVGSMDMDLEISIAPQKSKKNYKLSLQCEESHSWYAWFFSRTRAYDVSLNCALKNSLALASILTKESISEKFKFTDTVKLRDGSVHENVKAVFVNNYIALIEPNGTVNTFSKKEISKVSKADHSEQAVWSDERGKFTWKDAKAECGRMHMRLPKVEELETAFINKDTRLWSKYRYWSSEQPSSGKAYFYNISSGERMQEENIDSKYARNDTRCIQ